MLRFLLSRSMATAAKNGGAAKVPKAQPSRAPAAAATTAVKAPIKAAAPAKPKVAATASTVPAGGKKLAATEASKGEKKPVAIAGKKDTDRTKILSSYAVFMREYYTKNKPVDAKSNFGELSKACSSLWHSMSPEQKTKYSGVSTKVKTRRSRSALDMFRSHRMKELKDKPDAFKIAINEWKNMSESEKKAFTPPEAVARERSTQKKSAWQVFLTEFFAKHGSKETPFQETVKKASAQFKTLSEADKEKLQQKA